MKTEKLFLRGYNFNAARILDRMIDLVKEAGGYLVDTAPFVLEPRQFVIPDENQPGSPELTLRATTYIEFVLNGRFLYVQLGSNPFLDCLYVSENTDGSTISAAAEGREMNISDWWVGYSEYDYLDAKGVEANAKALLAYLTAHANTQLCRKVERKKIRPLEAA